jgi:hypothetical protein
MTDKIINLLITGINNRTRERNYFNKYCELSSGDITNEEFDKEIEDNEDKYVCPIKQKIELSKEELTFLLDLKDKLIGIEYVDDIEDLFSIDLMHLIKDSENQNNK